MKDVRLRDQRVSRGTVRMCCDGPWTRVIQREEEESLGLEKKTTVSKALAESSNFGENKTEL